MNLEDVRDLIADTLTLITVDAKGLQQAKERAARFLVVQAILESYILDYISSDKSKLTTLTSAVYAQTLVESEGKNVTEKKIAAESDTRYSSTREASERVDAIHNYIKTHIKIFDNAHVFFRQLGKD